MRRPRRRALGAALGVALGVALAPLRRAPGRRSGLKLASGWRAGDAPAACPRVFPTLRFLALAPGYSGASTGTPSSPRLASAPPPWEGSLMIIFFFQFSANFCLTL